MTFALTFAAIRRHAISVVFTALLTLMTAALLRASGPMSLALWIVTTLLGFEFWYAIEPTVIRQFGGCRVPTDAERQRVEAALGRSELRLLVAQSGDLAAARGLRCLVVGRDLLELLEDRAMSGYLAQITAPVHAANLAGFALVWLGNIPVLAASLVTRVIGQLGRLLAVIVGKSLVLPMVLFPEAFVCWAGRLFATMLIALVSATLLSRGFAAAGLLLMIAWLVMPCLVAVLGWESRRVEQSADHAAISAGYGAQLLEATELLAVAEARPVESSLLSVLCLPGRPMVERSMGIRRTLRQVDPAF